MIVGALVAYALGMTCVVAVESVKHVQAGRGLVPNGFITVSVMTAVGALIGAVL